LRAAKQLEIGALATFVVAAVAAILIRMQISGSLQWTGRSLTLLDPTYASKYIPIIASVSEHQPTTWTDFFFDLHMLVLVAPFGLFILFYNHRRADGAVFMILYGTIIWYFAGVMVRLMLTVAPAACVLGGVGISALLYRFTAIIKANLWWRWWGFKQPDNVFPRQDIINQENGSEHERVCVERKPVELVRITSASSVLVIAALFVMIFFYCCHCVFCASFAYSSPSIVVDAGTYSDGTPVLYDDYREAYFWLRQNTDPDAKILSWWDYGYQLSAMANRTVIVDNNTWNNTHIATVGRVLTSTEQGAYPILESLDVDYVLIVFGGKAAYASDDLNKLIWPIRIGSGVFPNDVPKEEEFMSPMGGMPVGTNAMPVFRESVAYKLSYFRFGEAKIPFSNHPPGFDNVRQQIVNQKIKLEVFEEAFTSENWIVRIYKVKQR
jgi:dolichyl-diphosphooligosaccharide--protein glycosyltransferase